MRVVLTGGGCGTLLSCLTYRMYWDRTHTNTHTIETCACDRSSVFRESVWHLYQRQVHKTMPKDHACWDA